MLRRWLLLIPLRCLAVGRLLDPKDRVLDVVSSWQPDADGKADGKAGDSKNAATAAEAKEAKQPAPVFTCLALRARLVVKTTYACIASRCLSVASLSGCCDWLSVAATRRS